MKLEFFRKICEKYSKTKFHENRSSGSRVVPCGRTDILDEAVIFRNSADALKFGFEMFNFGEFSCSVMEECSVLPSGLCRLSLLSQ
jgi:hypothetical protein